MQKPANRASSIASVPVRPNSASIADNADLLAGGDDAGFQNRVHLAMESAGFAEPHRPGTSRL